MSNNTVKMILTIVKHTYVHGSYQQEASLKQEYVLSRTIDQYQYNCKDNVLYIEGSTYVDDKVKLVNPKFTVNSSGVCIDVFVVVDDYEFIKNDK